MTEIIADLKLAKKKKGITNKQIADKTGIPEGTVARVFATKEYNFKYDTIKPIVELLLTNEIYDEDVPNPLPDSDIVELLKHINVEKNLEIDELKEQIIAFEDKYTNETKSMLSHIKTLRVCLAVLAVSILILVIIDFTVTNIGWFRF